MSYFARTDYGNFVTLLAGITVSSASTGYLGFFDPGHGPSNDEVVASADPVNPMLYMRWMPTYLESEGSLDPTVNPIRNIELQFRVWIEEGPHTDLANEILEDVYDGVVTAQVAGTPAGLQIATQNTQHSFASELAGSLAAHDMIIPMMGVPT